MKQAGQDAKKDDKRQEDMGKLKKAIDFGNETGKNLQTGENLKEGELDAMQKTYDYMDEGGLGYWDARSKALQDQTNEDKQEKESGRKEANDPGRIPPPDVDKARSTAEKMNDLDYQRLSADYEYAEENGKHLINFGSGGADYTGGKELKKGELGQMKEILNQYEQMHPAVPNNMRHQV